MKHFLSIIRWPNLVLLGIIEVLVFFRLLDWQNSLVGYWDLALLTGVTILLAAGGYIINDYYDRKIDQVNKPRQWIAGNVWSARQVLFLYMLVVLAGLILSVWLALRLELLPYLFLYPAAVTGLWLYSFLLKCMPVVGNLWVSLFCAGVILIVAAPDLIEGRKDVLTNQFWYYMVFAFLTTWYREIIKDIEDVEGDRSQNCKTAVVRWGLNAAKIMAVLLAVIIIVTLLQWESTLSSYTARFCLYLLESGIVASAAFVWWAKNKSYYHTASTTVKLVMLAGTLLLLF